MNKQIKYTLLLISITMGMPRLAMSQSPDELLEIAVASNQELKIFKKEYQAALEKAPQVSQLPNPELGLGVFILPVETRLGPQRGRISISQMFPWFGTLQAQEDWAITEAKAKFERIAATELELKYRIRLAYFALYELHASQAIIQRNIVLFQSLKSLSETKVSSGQATLANVLRLDLKIDELTQRLRLLENRKRKPIAEINQILQRDVQTPIVLPDSLVAANLTINRETLLSEIRESHPMVKMYQFQQEASETAIHANVLQGKPSFGIGADYINTGTRTDAFPSNNGRDAFLVSAKVSIPLYRKKYQAKAREEQFRIEAIEARKQETISLFETMIEKALTDHEEARLALELYQKQIRTTQSAINILEAAYAVQSASFDELLQLEVSLIEYELLQLKAVVKNHLAKAEIERYLPY